jgi:hypothetical protein
VAIMGEGGSGAFRRDQPSRGKEAVADANDGGSDCGMRTVAGVGGGALRRV